MKTINQVIEEKRKEFDELIGDVPQHAKYVIDKYTKDSCCVMCGHPAQPSVVVNKITSFIFTDYTTSLLTAVEEERGEWYKKGFINGFDHSGEGFNGEYHHPDVPKDFLEKAAKESLSDLKTALLPLSRVKLRLKARR